MKLLGVELREDEGVGVWVLVRYAQRKRGRDVECRTLYFRPEGGSGFYRLKGFSVIPDLESEYVVPVESRVGIEVKGAPKRFS